MKVDTTKGLMTVGGEFAIEAKIVNKKMQYRWGPTWAEWKELQEHEELVKLKERANGLLDKGGKGKGKKGRE